MTSGRGIAARLPELTSVAFWSGGDEGNGSSEIARLSGRTIVTPSKEDEGVESLVSGGGVDLRGTGLIVDGDVELLTATKGLLTSQELFATW